MKKLHLAFILLLCFGFMSFYILNDDPPYKNLKVLPRNISKEQMDSVMKHFTASLGVKCNFCHSFNQQTKSMDFVTDTNEHKQIARSMIKMTNQLNKKYFDIKNSKSLDAKLEVSCFTCHNGKEHPTVQAPKPLAPPAGQRD